MQRYYSTIYWHFTGSPDIDWNNVKSPEDMLTQGKPKPDEQAVKILKEIICSKTLKATSIEKLTDSIWTEKFCCTTDIPFKDLLTHAQYYGKVAIGFKAEMIQKIFLPVFYVSTDNKSYSEEVLKTLDSEQYIKNFIKMTDFTSENDGHTFYREREWRHIGDFNFNVEDVAALVVPNNSLLEMRKCLESNHFPEDISVLSWRLIEQA